MTTEKEEVKPQETKVTRKKRIPFGVPRTKLSINQHIEGYHLHWINDSVGRIYDAEQGGYEYVKPEEVGLSDTGDKVKRRVGVNEDGSALFAFLMKIRLDWYNEDEKERQNRVDEIDTMIKGGATEQVHKRYIPTSGISVKHS